MLIKTLETTFYKTSYSIIKMISKIKYLYKKIVKDPFKNFELNNVILSQTKELEWAHIYHDSIRGKVWLENLPLNVGRWAGNYSFFYVLNRILADYKPNRILDLGLGESSKFVSTYLENYLFHSTHVIVEQDEIWLKQFENRFELCNRSSILHCQLEKVIIKDFESNSYKDINEKIKEKFDLYIVDGPFGSDRYSRYDILNFVERFEENEEFIIMLDDTNRLGEQDTLKDIIICLKKKNINYFLGNYVGNKSLTVIATNKYKFVTSL